ncbi:uncharacterized protein LOC118200602 [Stegodyphus dumicola]|uniref:uncharacterized protein LOC118200602 n=1 Tax=Stegodyphus dumicola TaxID=202533 RepID=UPI0015A9ADE0|nr:uncharacterized protein LOC118200602 [Stegodyphus dumicola]
MLRNSMKPIQEKSVKFTDREKLQEKVLELEKLLLLSRKENEKMVHNFVKTNELLCKFMDKYADVKDSEKSSAKEIERLRKEINVLNQALEEKTAEIKNNTTTETQTEDVSDGKEERSCLTSHMGVNFITPSMEMLSPAKKKICSTSKFAFSDGLNKYVSKTLKEITKEHLPYLPDKFTALEVRKEEIILSEVMKRKHDMIEEDKELPLISNKHELKSVLYTSDTVGSKDACIAIDSDNSKENSIHVDDEKNEVNSLKDGNIKSDSIIKNSYELTALNEQPNKTKENETDNEKKNEQFRDISG